MFLHLNTVQFTLAVSGLMFGTVFICVVAALAMTAITDHFKSQSAA
jgi:hypothetical protein